MPKETPETGLVDYRRGRREDVKWMWPEELIERLLEKLTDDKSEKKDRSTD